MFALLHRLSRVPVFFCIVAGLAVGLTLNALAPAPAHAQADNHPCAPGKACRVWSLQTYNALTVAQLPACTAGATGKIIWATNGGSDGGGSTMQCDGTSWQQMGGGSSIETTTFTATAPLLLVDDGGTVNLSVAIIQISDAARDVANITAGACVEYSESGLTGRLFEAGDTCEVGFALSGVGGADNTLWQCWPDDTTSIGVRVCCVAGADCDPASQTIFYTVTCPDGSCE